MDPRNDENAPLQLEVAYDYRCPFARIAHEHVLAGLRAGAAWDVTFTPFSLSQAKVEPGGTDVWDAPDTDSGLLALQVSVAVRDTQPEHFRAVHEALFSLRHDHGGDLRSEEAIRGALEGTGVDVDAAFEAVATGKPLDAVREDHTRLVQQHEVWGVPAFISGGNAAFVRLMDRPTDDDQARDAIERLGAMLAGWPSLNEFKHFTLSR
jgi:protein-disulfide isomerase-like protein with CxxC motif